MGKQIICVLIHTNIYILQINQQFSGTPLSEFEANVFSVEISNAAGSRFVNSTLFTIIQLN